MRVVLALWIASALAQAGRAEEPQESPESRGLSCTAYLSEPEAERDRVAAMALWVWMRKNAEGLHPQQAGTLMASLPKLRATLDANCGAGGSLGKLAAGAVDQYVLRELQEQRMREHMRAGKDRHAPETGKP